MQLRALRRSVALAGESGYSTEVLVAANSMEALRDVQQILAEDTALGPVTIVDATATRGPSYARNEGVWASSGSLLLFCDADDVVDVGWVKALAETLGEADIAAGVRMHDLLNDPRSARGWSNQTIALPIAYHHLPFGTLSNLGIRRELFIRIGGCDQALITGEDIDLCWRGQYAGGAIELSPHAIVQYRLRRGLRAQFIQSYWYGVGDAILLTRHRQRGARRTARDSLRTIAGCGSQLVKFVIGYRRPIASYVLGNACGRVVGSARYRVWTL